MRRGYLVRGLDSRLLNAAQGLGKNDGRYNRVGTGAAFAPLKRLSFAVQGMLALPHTLALVLSCAALANHSLVTRTVYCCGIHEREGYFFYS